MATCIHQSSLLRTMCRQVAPGLQPAARQFCRSNNSGIRKTHVRAQAAGFWDRFVEAFSGNTDKTSSADANVSNKFRSASQALQALLCSDEKPDLARVEELVDELVSAEGLPFTEASLGGGPWVVLYTRGKPLLWNYTYSTGRLFNISNRAAQEFDPATRASVNVVEINGPNNLIEAYGTYEPVDDSTVTPLNIRVKISSGRLFLGSLELPLPIFGTGYFEVVYVDEALRVLRSASRIAVQIRADRLPDAP